MRKFKNGSISICSIAVALLLANGCGESDSDDKAGTPAGNTNPTEVVDESDLGIIQGAYDDDGQDSEENTQSDDEVEVPEMEPVTENLSAQSDVNQNEETAPEKSEEEEMVSKESDEADKDQGDDLSDEAKNEVECEDSAEQSAEQSQSEMTDSEELCEESSK